MIPRYEFKIPCAASLLPQIEAWVWLHPAHWRVAYPPRQVNSLYFDSFDLQSLNANLSGVGRREKLRLRWYGSDLRCVAGAQLELKCRRGTTGWKEITPFAGTLDLARGSWSALLATLRDGVDMRARQWLALYTQPVLINVYERAYYETPDGLLRLTLDTQLRAYDQRFAALPNLCQPGLSTGEMVVELKAPVDDAAMQRVSDLLTTFPARAERFSKYLQGLLAAPDFEDTLA